MKIKAPGLVSFSDSFKTIENDQKSIPLDVLRLIFGQLDTKSLVQVTAVCKQWKQVGNETHLWKQLFLAQFPKKSLPENDGQLKPILLQFMTLTDLKIDRKYQIQDFPYKNFSSLTVSQNRLYFKTSKDEVISYPIPDQESSSYQISFEDTKKADNKKLLKLSESTLTQLNLDKNHTLVMDAQNQEGVVISKNKIEKLTVQDDKHAVSLWSRQENELIYTSQTVIGPNGLFFYWTIDSDENPKTRVKALKVLNTKDGTLVTEILSPPNSENKLSPEQYLFFDTAILRISKQQIDLWGVFSGTQHCFPLPKNVFNPLAFWNGKQLTITYFSRSEENHYTLTIHSLKY